MTTAVLNLDPEFCPISTYETLDLEKKIFAGGEIHVKASLAWKVVSGSDLSNDKIIITHRIQTSDHLMEILMAKKAYEKLGIKRFELVIPYIPYARQDRVCNYGEAFSLKVFSDIINAQRFEKVTAFDVHSLVTEALIDNLVNGPNTRYVKRAVNDKLVGLVSGLTLVSPDVGASKKSEILFNELPEFVSLVKCDKVRDAKGEVSIEAYVDDLGGTGCMVVDDICDGGRTFISTAKELREKNCGPLYLFVTHGIFSRGFGELLKHYDKIFFTDSFNTKPLIETLDEDPFRQFKLSI